MKSSEITNIVSDVAARPTGTVAAAIAALQSSGKVLKGKAGRYGGVAMTPHCKANILLATTLEHPRGVDLGESVDRVRSLEMVLARRTENLDDSPEQGARGAFDFLQGLPIGPNDLGDVLDVILATLESGTFDKWAADDTIELSVDIYNRGRCALISINRREKRQGAYLAFGEQRSTDVKNRADFITRFDLQIFRRLAGQAS